VRNEGLPHSTLILFWILICTSKPLKILPLFVVRVAIASSSCRGIVKWMPGARLKEGSQATPNGLFACMAHACCIKMLEESVVFRADNVAHCENRHPLLLQVPTPSVL
jgi:hypothetical protein